MDTSDAPIISGGDSAPDVSALTGGSAPVAPPPPSPAGDSLPAPVAPQGPALISGAAPVNPIPGPSATPPPQAAGTPSVWKNLVMGAIYGLAGSAGSTHFGSGLAGGAAGVVEQKQREIQNAQAQQRINFESVQAADSHIRALQETHL